MMRLNTSIFMSPRNTGGASSVAAKKRVYIRDIQPQTYMPLDMMRKTKVVALAKMFAMECNPVSIVARLLTDKTIIAPSKAVKVIMNKNMPEERRLNLADLVDPEMSRKLWSLINHKAGIEAERRSGTSLLKRTSHD